MSEIKVNSIKGVGASAAAITVNNTDGTCTLASGSKLNNCTTDGTTNLTIADGNLVVGTSGHGIDFSATSGSGTSELLSDYEEGTWTPSITVGSGTITVGSVFHSQYTKIGRMVYITCRFTVSAVNSPSGQLKILGLPFTANSFAGLSLTTTGLADTDDKIPQGLVEYNTTFAMLRTFRDGIESDNISGFFQNGTAIIMSSAYNVA